MQATLQNNVDEPFPDSWVATTGPIALGMLTDIFCLIATHYDANEAKELWPLTLGQMQKWAVGTPFGFSASPTTEEWTPSEALVRIGCNEIAHLSETVFTLFPRMKKADVKMWLGVLCQNLAETLSHNIELESALHSDVVREVLEMDKVFANEEANSAIVESDTRTLDTPYGKGALAGTRVDEYDDTIIDISIIKLDSGATLYGPFDLEISQEDDDVKDDVNVESEDEQISNWQKHRKMKAKAGAKDLESSDAMPQSSKRDIMTKYISPLRVRCTSIYCVQQSLFEFLDMFAMHCTQEDISLLLDAVEMSRAAAAKASMDKSLSTYFEEAMRMEWGGGVEGAQAAFSSDSGLGHLGRCEMFFLTQEASANNVLVRLLSLLYCRRSDNPFNEWDTVAFSEPLLMLRMTDVLQKFIVSERENGRKLDPNVWRAASESGGKFAVHCTSFAAVVVNILYRILEFSDEHFDRQKGTLFPVLCSLISIQSEEIRMLVADVLNKKVSVLLGISSS